MRARRHRRIGCVAMALLASTVGASGLITREEALASAYPGATIEAERVFLTEAQAREAAGLSGAAAPRALVARYVAVHDGEVVGRAYVDTHLVRTKRESLLISLGPDGRVRRIDVTAFLEPREYRVPEAWTMQYTERALDDELDLRRAIRPVAGATLTAIATNEAVRRVLAIDRVLGAGDRGR